jgi:Ala-tRNA(Pro) deacylase
MQLSVRDVNCSEGAMHQNHTTTTYDRLIDLLESSGARFRLIDHAPEGRTELVSPMRGHPTASAAKCMIVMVKIGKKTKRFFLAVVPGDERVDVNAIKQLVHGTYAGFASPEDAERLAKSEVGTVLPFTFDDELTLIVDPGVFDHEEIFFNAARLDRSVGLSSADYRRVANPRVERITPRR